LIVIRGNKNLYTFSGYVEEARLTKKKKMGKTSRIYEEDETYTRNSTLKARTEASTKETKKE
jgi:hypothetical protein